MLTPDILNVAQSLLRRETPDSWLKSWAGCTDASAWLRAVGSQTTVLGEWLSRARAVTLFAQPLDLALLFRPEVFFNALRQQTAATSRVPVDSLVLACEWRADGTAASIAGAAVPCRLGGLRLQGALFDGASLSPALADSPSVVNVPVCTVAWVPASSPAAASAGGSTVTLPVYDSEAREKTVTRLHMPRSPSSMNPEQWVLAGAALFLASGS